MGGDSNSLQLQPHRGVLLFTVEDAFDIHGAGCVLFHGIPHSSEGVSRIQRGAAITLRRPDGVELQTWIRDFASVHGPVVKPFLPICLPLEITKSDVPRGTEVWFYPNPAEAD